MPEGAEGVELAWDVSPTKKIATVDKDGNVKAVAEGTATLTVTATQGKRRRRGNKNSYCGCNGNKRRRNRIRNRRNRVLTGVKASVEKAELKVGETTKATATIMPEGAEGVELAWDFFR